jgi:hypothetical protein
MYSRVVKAVVMASLAMVLLFLGAVTPFLGHSDPGTLTKAQHDPKLGFEG